MTRPLLSRIAETLYWNAAVRTDEDELCALYLRNLLQGRRPDREAIRKLVLASGDGAQGLALMANSANGMRLFPEIERTVFATMAWPGAEFLRDLVPPGAETVDPALDRVLGTGRTLGVPGARRPVGGRQQRDGGRVPTPPQGAGPVSLGERRAVRVPRRAAR